MARPAWEEAPVDFRPGGMGKLAAFGRWLVRLFVIAALTLGAAFYAPLYRAHRALTANHALVLEKNRVLERDLSQVRGELAVAQAARAALQAMNAEAASKLTIKKTHLDEMLAAARAKLQRFVDRKVLSLDVREDKLVVAFSPAVVQGLEASPAPLVASRLGLCEVAAALANGPGTHAIDATAYVDPATPALGAETAPNSRDVASRLANRVSETLEAKCQLPAGRAAVVVRGQPSIASAGLELAVGAGP